MTPNHADAPLVSVIMPFFNAEAFMKEAVESVVRQIYTNWEVLFVDDGSSDSSTLIARRYVEMYPAKAAYLEHDQHRNLGISASRNAGLRRASGKYVAFLDADDVWLPQRLARQVEIMESLSEASMVFGSSQYWYSWTGNTADAQRDFVPDPGVKTEVLYSPPELLLKLYPLGQATAPSMSNLLVRREFVERAGAFEEEFRGLYEDQAFLVKVYLTGHVFVSGECWDRYRIHPNSCLSVGNGSGEYHAIRNKFLNWFEGYLNGRGCDDTAIRAALSNAFELRSTPQEVTHFGGWLFRVVPPSQARLTSIRSGIRVEIERNLSQSRYDIQLNLPRLNIECHQQYRITFDGRADELRPVYLGVAMAHQPWSGLGLYRKVELTPEWRSFDEEFTAGGSDENARIHFDLADDSSAVELASVTLRLPDGTPAPGGINFGDLRRVKPISVNWGFDRGLPIDRYYIESFLATQALDIRGRVLEIGDATYTRRFGGNRVHQSDVLHVSDGNPAATLIGDLTDAPQIPSAAFDCIILTQTLQLIYDVHAAIRTLYRILRPGGIVLATFPGISQHNDKDWGKDWCWTFTPRSGRQLFEDEFGPDNVRIRSFGNVLSAASFLYGISAGELTLEELDSADRGYEVTIAVRAMRGEQT